MKSGKYKIDGYKAIQIALINKQSIKYVQKIRVKQLQI